jgi:hypothetical protein
VEKSTVLSSFFLKGDVMAKVDMEMEELDNSFEKRLKDEKEDNHLKPVVTKKDIVTTKPSVWKKFKDSFISEDMQDVQDYIFLDIIVPGIKNAVLDTLERIFFSSSSGRDRDRRDSSYGRTSYSSYYKSERNGRRRDRDRRDNDEDRRDKGVDYRNIVVTHREDAEEIVRQMRDYIRDYDSVSVARLLDLIDEPGRYTDNNYGWTDERDINIKRLRNGYLIDVPEAEYIGD